MLREVHAHMDTFNQEDLATLRGAQRTLGSIVHKHSKIIDVQPASPPGQLGDDQISQ